MTDSSFSYPEIKNQYTSLIRRRVLVLALLLIALLLTFCLDIAVGPSMLSLREVIGAMLNPDSVDLGTKVIVWEVRLPYSVMAVLVGAALSLAGLEMQTTLNNPMASPFTLGVSASASFGAALAIVIGFTIPGVPHEWAVAVNAFLFAFGSVMLLQLLSGMRGASAEALVLFGIALDFTFKALIGITQYIATAEALQQFIFWSLGSLTRSNWDGIRVLSFILLIIIPFSASQSWKLTAVRLGEENARNLGIHTGRLRFFSMVRISILTATAVAFVGTIGFIGLVGPHIAKMLIGEDHRFSIPASILSGAVVMSLASVASKAVVSGAILPVGVVTSLIGVPVFIWLIFTRRKSS